jgi:sulfate transport system permease protein
VADALRRFGLRGIAFSYLAAILLGPLALVFYRTFENGFGAAWEAL